MNIQKVRNKASKGMELLTVSLQPYSTWGPYTNHPVPTLKNVYYTLSKHINNFRAKLPDCMDMIIGDFNNSRNTNCPGLVNHVTCHIRKHSTLGLFFCNVKDAYTGMHQIPIRKCDHDMPLPLPKYQPIMKQNQTIRSVLEFWRSPARLSWLHSAKVEGL